MATINTTTWQYTYTDKNWKTQTATIKNWSNVTDSQVQQLTNAANNSGGRMTVTNDTSNAGYWNQRWTGNLMYNWNAAITNMASDGNGYAITTYSDWTRSYNNQATWEKISENTYKSILANTNALWLNSSVKGLSNTYNTYWDLWGASSKPKYQWFGTMTGYNPALTTANLGTWYQFGTMAEQAEKNSPWYLEWRNNELASALLNSGITDQAWIRNFLSQYEWFNSYDPTGQNNTVQAIYNRIWQMQSWLGNKEEDMLGDQIMQGQFLDAVNSILENNYWLWDLDSIKDMFWAETYYNIKNALESVEWVWDATDPASRSQLEWYLQQIIGSAIWTASEQSELNLMMSSVLSKFTDQAQKQIQQDVLAVQNLKTRWYTVDKIASETGMSKDQVNQLLLLSQWLPSQIGKYYEMNNDAEDLITEDYERNRENLEQQYKFNLEVANQEITQLREDFNKTYLDQQEANENTLHNMDLIAWMTGTWYSRRWLEGMSYAQQQANAVLNNLIDNYDRNNLDIANSIKSMTMAYQQNDAELVDQMNDAILNAKNNYIAQVSNIQSKYWLVWLEWQQAIAQAVQWFVNQAETIYNNAFNRAWTNTNNLISAVSSIWAIEQQQIQTKQMKIAEFQQDSMYMTQNQLKDYAQRNGLQMEYQQLVWYQQEATINTLNSVSPWLWNQYANKISQMLSKWYTPQQAVSEILNSDEVKSMTGGDRAVSGDYIYDKNTWEVRSLKQTMNGGSYSWQDTSVKTNDYTYKSVDLMNGASVSVWDQFEVAWDTWTITQIGWSKTWWIDFAPSKAWTHDPIPSFENGTVVRKWTDSSTWNNYIEILNDNGYVYRYNHLESVPTIKVWQQVQAGDIIAKMWNSGKTKWATWVHLDLAVYDWSRANSTSVSPLDQATQTRIIFGGNTSASWWDDAQKQIYLEQVRRWMITNTDITKIWQIAAEQWWWDEFREAMNEWLKVSLTERQQWIKNTADTKFTNNAIVKEFENSINQIEQLTTALNDKSWAWDMSAIFTFMKTLDPNSVVRESEFEAAANTAWVVQKARVIFKKLTNWQKLSADQRESFKKIAIEFIKTKAQNYNIKYDELRRTYTNAQIDEQWLPTNMADIVLQQLWVTGSWSSTTSTSSWWGRWL